MFHLNKTELHCRSNSTSSVATTLEELPRRDTVDATGVTLVSNYKRQSIEIDPIPHRPQPAPRPVSTYIAPAPVPPPKPTVEHPQYAPIPARHDEHQYAHLHHPVVAEQVPLQPVNSAPGGGRRPGSSIPGAVNVFGFASNAQPKVSYSPIQLSTSRTKSTTEEIVKNLTVPLIEHAQPLKMLTAEEKRKAVQLKLQEIEHQKGQPPFYDMFMREHSYLRISLTEKCNFRCLYCMPAEGVPLKPKDKMLKNEEVLRLVKLFADHGIDKVRLTGGEPTIRKDIVQIVEGIASTPGVKDVGITTNGLVLPRFLPDLKNAGLTKVNISIDSLDRQKFAKMTRRDGFDKVWKSIELAQDYFPKVKLNVVVIRNQNENEIVDFVNLTANRNLDIRFIEFMPFGGNEFKNDNFYGYREMLSLIVEKFGDDVIRLSDSPNDTTKAYKIEGFQGQFGFISSMSDHFCNTCNRLRITADGNLKVCLHGNSEVSLRDKIRDGSSDEQLSEIIQKAVNNKKARHAVFRNGRSQKSSQSSYDSYRRLTQSLHWSHSPNLIVELLYMVEFCCNDVERNSFAIEGPKFYLSENSIHDEIVINLNKVTLAPFPGPPMGLAGPPGMPPMMPRPPQQFRPM
ncbi:hypothetical protein L5515_016481 [Caenorhabditis briggsae]|uniref:GTP 3',8-cyclase n=1 Tax=Caenorhabditis briggsae TaxID=6238 RepID=A0AAE9FC78_CAEBR|nr:hypothetical protein L5515_016481 [Caenorhabditis briggsae]